MAGGQIVGKGKTVVLTCSTSGIDDGEAAEIQVFKSKDSSSLDTLSSKVKNKVISAEWVAKGPEPEDEEQGWEVYYKAKCKGLETKATKLLVYNDTIEVESVDEEENALPDATFRVTAGQEVRERNTGSSGIRKEEHLPPGEVLVEWIPPFELIEWIDEKGPKRKAKVKKVLPARLVWPEQGAHRQWVNLAADDAKPEQGSLLKVKVTLVGGKRGDKVYAKLEPAEENSKRDDPAPEIKNGITADWCEHGGIEAELADDDGKPDCEAVIEVELGKAGGDVFTLSVGGSKETWSETLTITNWRKLFWQATRAQDSRLPDTARLEDCLREAFIEYERYGEAIVAEGDVPAGSFMAAADLRRGSGKLLVIGDHNSAQVRSKFVDTHAPIGAHVIVCDAQYDGGAPGSPHEQTIEAEAIGETRTLMIDEPELYDVFATAIQDGQPSLRSGSWESKAPAGHAHAGKRGDLTAEDVRFGVGSTPDHVQVVLPPEAAAIVGDGSGGTHPVKLTLTLRVARGPFLGESEGAHQLVIRLPDDAAMCGVMVHELGHAIHQTLVEPPPGLSEGDHGRGYTEHGHLGHHCGAGLSDAEWALAEYRSVQGHCVMFGGGTAEGPFNQGRFCEKCLPFVKADACDKLEGDKSKAEAPVDAKAEAIKKAKEKKGAKRLKLGLVESGPTEPVDGLSSVEGEPRAQSVEDEPGTLSQAQRAAGYRDAFSTVGAGRTGASFNWIGAGERLRIMAKLEGEEVEEKLRWEAKGWGGGKIVDGEGTKRCTVEFKEATIVPDPDPKVGVRVKKARIVAKTNADDGELLLAVGPRPARPSAKLTQMEKLAAQARKQVSGAADGFCLQAFKKNVLDAGGYGDILDIYLDERFPEEFRAAKKFRTVVEEIGLEKLHLESLPLSDKPWEDLAKAPRGAVVITEGHAYKSSKLGVAQDHPPTCRAHPKYKGPGPRLCYISPVWGDIAVVWGLNESKTVLTLYNYGHLPLDLDEASWTAGGKYEVNVFLKAIYVPTDRPAP